VKHNSKLATDADLRQLQLRWAKDDIWMRRVVFALAVLLSIGSIVYAILSPSTGAAAIAGGTTVVGVPVAYFFGRRTRA
jgi:small neutral amino acid transporter SnatA (MarC family)